uniref:Uncharacterized protein n=1 Tax=Arundo donax TaxID=35708 RepID=A0A0A9AC09_ARUDO
MANTEQFHKIASYTYLFMLFRTSLNWLVTSQGPAN